MPKMGPLPFASEAGAGMADAENRVGWKSNGFHDEYGLLEGSSSI